MSKKASCTIRLIATVRDKEGRIISETCKNNDIYLWNWAVMIAQLLKMNLAQSDPTTYQFKSINGATQTTSSGQMYYAAGIDDRMIGRWRVQIGSGTTAPAITDYCLEAYLQEVIPTNPEIITAGSILKVVMSSTFAFASETTVAETGIRGNGWHANGDIPYLLTRDTFTPATVPAGGTITLQHELWFNGTP